jgi:thiamine biosynthesis protein ThiS
MNITLNGESRRLDPGRTVADLLKELELGGQPVAVERNGETLPKSSHGTTTLAEGDRIEVVTFVGGG